MTPAHVMPVAALSFSFGDTFALPFFFYYFIYPP